MLANNPSNGKVVETKGSFNLHTLKRSVDIGAMPETVRRGDDRTFASYSTSFGGYQVKLKLKLADSASSKLLWHNVSYHVDIESVPLPPRQPRTVSVQLRLFKHQPEPTTTPATIASAIAVRVGPRRPLHRRLLAGTPSLRQQDRSSRRLSLLQDHVQVGISKVGVYWRVCRRIKTRSLRQHRRARRRSFA